MHNPIFRRFSALAALLLVACSDKPAPTAAPPAMPPMPVTVLEVSPTNIPLSLEAVGQTEGSREVEVRARINGILLKRHYAEGSQVKAGQVLFQVDPIPYELSLTQARAQHNEARARYEQSSREARRLQSLLAQQAVSQKEVDDATSAQALTQAALQAAEATVKQAELNLTYTTVSAPVGGISGRALKSEGSLIGSADNLLTSIVQAQPIWVRFALSESELAQLPGKLNPNSVEVELILPNGSTYPSKGKLNFAGSAIDPRLGTQPLRAEFANPNLQLLPGQFVRTRISMGQREGVYLVPQSAVMQSDQGRFVLVAGANNTAEVRPIQAGGWRGKDWVVLGGLKPGDKVILDNLVKLRPGAPIAPKPPGAPQATSTTGK